MVSGNSLDQVTVQVAKGLDDVADTLRWCKKHLHERKALDAIRLAQANLSYLALALDWQMEGEGAKTEQALERFWWGAHRDDWPLYDDTSGH
jgi:hypothetical protein